ncbi:MAG: 2-dehydro-3-deoxygalactonokinase, partial [Trueperaceae bacterium]
VAAAVFSGMITSNLGLLEVPHLIAPVGPTELATAVRRRDFPEITPLPCYFIPGVRTSSQGDNLADLDVLRGEEVEIMGLRSLLSITSDAVFLHYGSHHKAINVDAEGKILASKTSLTGELFSALSEHTMLKGSLESVEASAIVEEAWRHGLADGKRVGVGRALFLVRVGEQIAGYSKSYMTSYLLGVLTLLDLSLLDEMKSRRLVLYGRGKLKHILAEYLHGRGLVEIVLVDDDTADVAAAIGAAELMLRVGAVFKER